jgi:hypothetical protein
MRAFPRRRWVVESRPAMGPGSWERSLGPYFREATAKDMLRRFRWFAPGWLVEARIRDTRGLAGGARAAQEETVVLACNCVGTPCEGGWTITTVALFCPYKHRRGVVVLDDPKRPGRRRKWSRSASGDARAAQEDK